ncbi:MAG TPA: winged helix-turn-helix transcriptional regulator [Pseudonocardiaceae bacterium]
MEIWDISYRRDVFGALGLLRGQWTVAVLSTLATGELQYKEILAEVNNSEARIGWSSHGNPLSDRVLSDTLRRARSRGLVDRRSEARMFGPVWYRLTPIGQSLLYAARPLGDWAEHHRDVVHGAMRWSPRSVV